MVLADTAEITLTAVGSETDAEDGDFTEMLYLQNKSDQPLTFKLDENSVVLFFSTEGDTDRENYKQIVWDGKYPSVK